MKKLLILIAFVGLYINAFSVNYQVSAGGSVAAQTGDHIIASGLTAGSSYTITICAPSGYADHHASLTFAGGFNVPTGNTVTVYDGDNTSAPVIAVYDNNNFSSAFAMTTNCTNVSGCMTLVVDCQSTLTFDAEVHYEFCCQAIQVGYTSNPPAVNDNIDVCDPYEFTVNATVSFPNASYLASNGWGYAQSAANCTFEWDMRDGNVYNTQSVTHTYAGAPSGYAPSLTVSDQFGCVNTNVVVPHVRMSIPPTFDGTGTSNGIWTYCQGDSVPLIGQVSSEGFQSSVPPVYANTTFLPDGNGAIYTTSITYDIFDNNATLTNASLLTGVWVSMEHSFMGDLNISIACPNNQSIVLHTFSNGSGTFLGVPIDNDSDLSQGTCWDYGWSSTASQTWTQAAGSVSTLPSGEYLPDETFNGLVGCPLNGTWTISIQDNWSSDNGYICSWWIDFSQTLFPNPWDYQNTYTATSWEATQPPLNVITSGATGSFTATGTYGGQFPNPQLGTTVDETRPFKFTVTDDFGCSYDTTINVTFRPDDASICCIDPTPNIGPNDVVCGRFYNLEVFNGWSTPGNYGSWTYTTTSGGTADFVGGSDILNPAVTVTNYGTYTFTWTEVNGGCTTSVAKTVQFLQEPNANAGEDDFVCGLNYNLDATAPGAGESGHWVTQTGHTYSDVNNPLSNVIISPALSYGAHTSIWVLDNGTCTDTAKVRITYLEPPTAFNYPDTTDVCGNLYQFIGQTTYGGFWTVENYLGSEPATSAVFYNHETMETDIYDDSATVAVVGFGEWIFAWHEVNQICEDIDYVHVTFIQDEYELTTELDAISCLNSVQLLVDTVGFGNDVWRWTIDPQYMDTMSSIIHVNYDPTDPYTYVEREFGDEVFGDSAKITIPFIITKETGTCSSFARSSVTFYQAPTPYIGRDTLVCSDQISFDID
ncbi:MAG: proprotein convertase P-domain-containing protein, partial [Bacteroidales bacterium]|nr:proprotein convertase P-domain-containing protein [Bacteroidales bacterium]